MIKKQGITVTAMVVTIIILIILAGTITFSVYSTINYSKLSAWANEIMYIQDVVYEELNTSSSIEFTLGNTVIDVSQVNDIEQQFGGETITEDNTVSLKILDLGKLKITNTTYGNLETETDVYAISEETGRVYYVQGIDVDRQVYYSLTESLKNRFGLNTVASKLTSIVFVPSAIGHSNQPITVTVKVPNTYTYIVISTSNDEIQIGSQIEKENTYEYMVNENGITGNYTITVSYNDGTQTLTSTYKVTGYDVISPVINPVVYENIVYKETDTQKIEYLTNVTATDESGIKVMKYAIGTIEQDAAKEYFAKNTNVVTNGRINLNRASTIYTIYAEDNAGNISVLSFDKNNLMHEKWKANVSYIQDKVPIPKGFVASQATGENTKDGGLVIYEGTEPVTDENVEQAKRTRNQYVWVPVAKKDFATKFVRKDYINSTSKVVDSNGNYNALGAANVYWEVMVDGANMPLVTQDLNYMTSTTLKEVQAMYASVKEYEGFYIARYEAGIDTERTVDNGVFEPNVYSMMGKITYTYIPWSKSSNMSEDTGGTVELARSIYPNTNEDYGVVSTLIYGVQWDRTLAWWLEVGAKDGKGNIVTSVTDSTSYGNYVNRAIAAGDFNAGARYATLAYLNGTWTHSGYQEATATTTKASGKYWILSTGALKAASVNNIYDMAGNMWEATMEGNSSSSRTFRGGAYSNNGSTVSVPYRNGNGDPTIGYSNVAFRLALYIKK